MPEIPDVIDEADLPSNNNFESNLKEINEIQNLNKSNNQINKNDDTNDNSENSEDVKKIEDSKTILDASTYVSNNYFGYSTFKTNPEVFAPILSVLPHQILAPCYWPRR